MTKPLFKYLILPICLLGVSWKIEDKLVDSFNIDSIRNSFPCNKLWNLPTTHADCLTITNILNQPYYYLSSGSQSYVFISKDKQHVLKFFKNNRWRVLFYHTWLAKSSRFFKNYVHQKEEGEKATYHSCFLSFDHFKDQTAIEYLKLNAETSSFHAHLFDPLGKPHLVNLSDIPFLLQKKITLTHERWERHLKLHGLNSFETFFFSDLEKLLSFSIDLKKQGYTHKDPHFLMNFGFDNDNPICIDIGGFTYDPLKGSKHFYQSDLRKIKNKLTPWINKHVPELKTPLEIYFQKLIENQKGAENSFLNPPRINHSIHLVIK